MWTLLSKILGEPQAWPTPTPPQERSLLLVFCISETRCFPLMKTLEWKWFCRGTVWTQNWKVSPLSQLKCGSIPKQEEKPLLSDHRWCHFSCAHTTAQHDGVCFSCHNIFSMCNMCPWWSSLRLLWPSVIFIISFFFPFYTLYKSNGTHLDVPIIHWSCSPVVLGCISVQSLYFFSLSLRLS